MTPATKAIVICSPNNPTGCILDAASLDAVARVADQAGIYVICDDVYNRLVYVDGYERFAQRHPELREQTVVIESFSKPWAMTGWRLGWLVAAAPVIAEIAKSSPIPSIERRLLRDGRRGASPDRRPNPPCSKSTEPAANAFLQPSTTWASTQ